MEVALDGIGVIRQFLIHEGQSEPATEVQIVLMWDRNVSVGGINIVWQLFDIVWVECVRLALYLPGVERHIRAAVVLVATADEFECVAQFLSVDGNAFWRVHAAPLRDWRASIDNGRRPRSRRRQTRVLTVGLAQLPQFE
jgi:hypothetical protein